VMGDREIPHFIYFRKKLMVKVDYMEPDLTKKLPQHIAIILDGNGRWAKSHNLDRSQGHIEGVRRVDEIVDEANLMGIKVLTLFTFSTENWSRPQTEINMLMSILTKVLNKKIKSLIDRNIKFQMIGRKERIPHPLLKTIENVVEQTKQNNGLIVNLAFNYGARLEIIDAIKNLYSDVRNQKVDFEDINEELFSQYLYTKDLPDPDLLIRTSGEKRISNFLLWQLSYAEFYFIEKYWPDFTIEEFKKAIIDYQNRERRYGTINKVEA